MNGGLLVAIGRTGFLDRFPAASRSALLPGPSASHSGLPAWHRWSRRVMFRDLFPQANDERWFTILPFFSWTLAWHFEKYVRTGEPVRDPHRRRNGRRTSIYLVLKLCPACCWALYLCDLIYKGLNCVAWLFLKHSTPCIQIQVRKYTPMQVVDEFLINYSFILSSRLSFSLIPIIELT